MRKGFIEINGVMFDFEEYLEEVRLLREYAKLETKECLRRFDFELVSQSSKNRKAVLKFYNRRLDIVIKVEFSKKGKVKFV